MILTSLAPLEKVHTISFENEAKISIKERFLLHCKVFEHY